MGFCCYSVADLGLIWPNQGKYFQQCRVVPNFIPTEIQGSTATFFSSCTMPGLFWTPQRSSTSLHTQTEVEDSLLIQHPGSDQKCSQQFCGASYALLCFHQIMLSLGIHFLKMPCLPSEWQVFLPQIRPAVFPNTSVRNAGCHTLHQWKGQDQHVAFFHVDKISSPQYTSLLLNSRETLELSSSTAKRH